MSNLCTMPLTQLRDLIERQLIERRKALAEVADLDQLLLESLAEFDRRVHQDSGEDR